MRLDIQNPHYAIESSTGIQQLTLLVHIGFTRELIFFIRPYVGLTVYPNIRIALHCIEVRMLMALLYA